MIHVIEGDGKGKTTAAVGLAVRAAGHGQRVLFMQFLKGDGSGEIPVLRQIPGITVRHAPVNYGFTFQMTAEQLQETARAYDALLSEALASDAQLLVLDEVLHALNAGLVEEEPLRKLLDREGELVLTGQNAPAWLLDRADYISEVQKRRHPYDRGVPARPGIEY